MMLEATCYILKGKRPVPCDDIEIWQKFMDDVPARTLSSDQVGKCKIHTTFVGANLGSEIMPKFFRTMIIGDNGDNDPWLTETWEQAEVKHRTVVRASVLLEESSRKHKAGKVSGYKVVECSILPDDELKFVMESEEAAIQLLPPGSENWSRDGRILIFHPSRKKQSHL